MSNLSEIVGSLEKNIGKLLDKQKRLKETNVKLEEELGILNAEKQELEEQVAIWKDKGQSLRLANSLLGSDQYNRETKLKINALIREIDQCIIQLSD
ncbi:MAG: hypothetical protein WBA61_02640 [Aequorivita sp.]